MVIGAHNESRICGGLGRWSMLSGGCIGLGRFVLEIDNYRRVFNFD